MQEKIYLDLVGVAGIWMLSSMRCAFTPQAMFRNRVSTSLALYVLLGKKLSAIRLFKDETISYTFFKQFEQ